MSESVSPSALRASECAFLDNCEQAAVGFRVENAGTVPLTNVRVTAIEESPSGKL